MNPITQRVLRARANYIDHLKMHIFGEPEKREQLDDECLLAWYAWDQAGRPDLDPPDDGKPEAS